MNDSQNGATSYLKRMVNGLVPLAQAIVHGSADYPSVGGLVTFYQQSAGTLVVAQFMGLPGGSGCASRVFGFHIHEHGQCTGSAATPFSDAGGHYNPGGCQHPQHAGDMPPIFGNNGSAWQAFATNRFTVKEVLGLSVIVHAEPDDFTTQPAGNSGVRIACGIIQAL